MSFEFLSEMFDLSIFEIKDQSLFTKFYKPTLEYGFYWRLYN